MAADRRLFSADDPGRIVDDTTKPAWRHVAHAALRAKEAAMYATIETEKATRVDIRAQALMNDAFRRVIHTGAHEQVVVMTLPADGEIGEEVHPDTDQLFYFVDGEGEAVVAGEHLTVAPGDLVFVEAGTRHNILNRTRVPLRLITVYAPPAHAPGTVHQTREDAEAAEH
jgi:mannose-6-phosphate isomerase-like protein (cupin superfamily)